HWSISLTDTSIGTIKESTAWSAITIDSRNISTWRKSVNVATNTNTILDSKIESNPTIRITGCILSYSPLHARTPTLPLSMTARTPTAESSFRGKPGRGAD
ncbi:unnamed protein product, partial [Ceratitis capitata]